MKLLPTPADVIPADDALLALLLLASSSRRSSEKRDRPLPLDIGRGALREAAGVGCPKLELTPEEAGADCV